MSNPAPKQKVVWKPLPGTQTQALTCPCNHVLLHGPRGWGKTDVQLMMFRRYVGIGYGEAWRGVIFDREYSMLDDIVKKSQRWFPQFGDGVKFLASKGDYRWVWPTGEQLLFRQFREESDYNKYHGQEYSYQGWNELTKQPNPKGYDAMLSCLRSSFVPDLHTPRNEDGSFSTPDGMPLPEIPSMVVSTTNPHGAGHNWVKSRFIDPVPNGKILRTTTNIFNPRTQKQEDFTSTQVALFGSYRENRFLTPKYVADLENIKEPNKRRAWLLGDWNIVAGGAIDDLWNEAIHVTPRFPIPPTWHTDRSFDWGSTHPYSVGFWAESNGEDVVLPDGKIFRSQPGSLIRFDEMYGTAGVGLNEGVKHSPTRVAKDIITREKELLNNKWMVKFTWPGPADTQIWNEEANDDGELESKASKMEDQGIEWTRGKKGAGSRKNGLDLFRDRLEASVLGEGPGIYFMDNCRASIATLPTLPRDEKNPDDVDTEAEDHVYDDVRYRCLAGNNRFTTQIKINAPH